MFFCASQRVRVAGVRFVDRSGLIWAKNAESGLLSTNLEFDGLNVEMHEKIDKMSMNLNRIFFPFFRNREPKKKSCPSDFLTKNSRSPKSIFKPKIVAKMARTTILWRKIHAFFPREIKSCPSVGATFFFHLAEHFAKCVGQVDLGPSEFAFEITFFMYFACKCKHFGTCRQIGRHFVDFARIWRILWESAGFSWIQLDSAETVGLRNFFHAWKSAWNKLKNMREWVAHFSERDAINIAFPSGHSKTL